MNDEIRKILDKFDKKLENYDLDKKFGQLSVDSIGHLFPSEMKTIKDYITNLQQENEMLKAQLTDTEWEYQNTRCKYEKQYKKGITEELIEDIEECFFNRENPSMIPIDSLDVCHIFGYIDYLRDYKSRIEKAVEYINKNKKVVSKYEAKDTRLPLDTFMWGVDNLLNILQNGSDESVKD